MAATFAVALAGLFHTASLWRRQSTREACVVAGLWLITAVLVWAVTQHLPPDPVASLLLRLFGGLSSLLRSF